MIKKWRSFFHNDSPLHQDPISKKGLAAQDEQGKPHITHSARQAPSDSLIVELDKHGLVQHCHGAFAHQLVNRSAPYSLTDCLYTPSAVLSLGPELWHEGGLDLSFKTQAGPPLHTRGWLQQTASGWQLMLTDISDLVRKAHHNEHKVQLFHYVQAQAALFANCTSLEQQMKTVLAELALRLKASSVAIALPHAAHHWYLYLQHSQPAANVHWWQHYRLAEQLHVAAAEHPIRLNLHALHTSSPPITASWIWAVPCQSEPPQQAWLLCAYDHAQPQPSYLSASDWSHLGALLMGPLLRRLQQDQRQQTVRRQQALQQLHNVGWCEYDPQQALFVLAPNLLNTLNLSPTQPVPLAKWLSLIANPDRAEFELRLKNAVCEQQDLQQNIRLLIHNETRWYQCRLHASSAKSHGYLMGSLLDIHDLEQHKQSALAANNRLTSLVSNAPAIIYVLSYNEGALTPTFISASAQSVLGWSSEQLQQRPIAELLHPEDRERYFERTRQLLAEGLISCRYRLRDSQNNYHWLLDEARLLRDALGQPQEVVGLYIDITETHIATEQRLHSEARYRALVEDSPAIICRYQPGLTLTYSNELFNRLLGQAPFTTQTLSLAAWLAPEQITTFKRRLANLTPQTPLAEAEFCLHLPHRDPLWLVWAERGIFDSQGRLCEIQAVGRDNTEVYETKLQLYQNTKMAILGEMATTLAHEMNQPLNVISIALANLQRRIAKDAYSSDYLTHKLLRIEEQVARSAQIINHMRVFGRRSALDKTHFNPQQAIEGALSLTRAALEKSGIDIKLELTPLPLVLGHLDQLEQVFINLLINAKDAMTQTHSPETTPALTIRSFEHETQIMLQVEDNGGGIAEHQLNRIFEPFFTTKAVGVGTGLGLSVSHGIIAQMQGELSVENTAHGALFTLRLPPALVPNAAQLAPNNAH